MNSGPAKPLFPDEQLPPECAVERALAVIDGRWTTLILRDLLAGTRRFSELRASLRGVSPKTLTERLRDLERHGVLTRTVYPEVPPRVEYALTDKGRALAPVVAALAEWGGRWTGGEPPSTPPAAAQGPR